MRRVNSLKEILTTGRLLVDAGYGVTLPLALGRDTGWRNVTALSGVVTSGTIRLRRVGDIVYWRIEAVSSTTDPDAVLNLTTQVLPGFRDLNWQRYALALPVGARARTTAGSELRLEAAGTTGATFEGQFTYPTNDAWPTTLPGTAA